MRECHYFCVVVRVCCVFFEEFSAGLPCPVNKTNEVGFAKTAQTDPSEPKNRHEKLITMAQTGESSALGSSAFRPWFPRLPKGLHGSLAQDAKLPLLGRFSSLPPRKQIFPNVSESGCQLEMRPPGLLNSAGVNMPPDLKVSDASTGRGMPAMRSMNPFNSSTD